MTDIVDRKTRSRMMAGIGGKNTKPELAVRSYLHRQGFRFRLHRRDLPGKPDIVLPRHAAVVFVHGCFWHRHARCRFAYFPKTRAKFWLTKFDSNIKRDKRQRSALRKLGWNVCVIWECQVANPMHLARLLKGIKAHD